MKHPSYLVSFTPSVFPLAVQNLLLEVRHG